MSVSPITVAVLGGGSWATALVKILTENKVKTFWWMRNPDDVNHILDVKHNRRYLSNVQFNLDYAKPTTDLEAALKHATYVVVAVPAAFVESALANLRPQHFEGKYVVSAVKGMLPIKNILITDYFEQKFGVAKENLCVIGGPCHAEEVAMEKQSYLTIGGHNLEVASDFGRLLSNRYVKATPLQDVDGIEYCAVMKNIIALTCGIAHGQNYGDNFQAVMVSNAMLEIERFLDKVMPLHRSLVGSAYLGDLLVTAYSQFSRNRTFGNMIGRGYSVKSAQMEMNMVAEGYYATRSIYELNQKLKVDMPITHAAYNVLYQKISPAIEMSILKEKFF